MGWFDWLFSPNEAASQFVYLDGGSSWRVQSSPVEAQYLQQLPIGTQIIVEVVPRSNEVVALRHEGTYVASFFAGRYARSLHQAVRQARKRGYVVLAHAKRIRPMAGSYEFDENPHPPNSYLEVRSVLAADLLYWLAEHPAKTYAELNWQFYGNTYAGEAEFGDVRRSLLGPLHSTIVRCSFFWRDEVFWGAVPDKVIDVVTHGRVVGVVMNHQELGTGYGLARINYHKTAVMMRLCPAQPDGRYQLNTDLEPFKWRGQRGFSLW